MMGRRLALLLAAALGLAGYSLWSGDNALMAYLDPPGGAVSQSSQPKAETGQPAGPIAAAALNPLHGLVPEQFEEILKRPLFNPSRAPAPPPPAPQPEPEQVAEPVQEEPPVNPDDFTLLGIAARDGAWTAVLRWNPTNEVFRLRTGGEMQGWTVAAIAPQGITVTKDDQSLDIKMFKQKQVPQPIDNGEYEDGSDDSGEETPQTAVPQQPVPQGQAMQQQQTGAEEMARRREEQRRAMEADGQEMQQQ